MHMKDLQQGLAHSECSVFAIIIIIMLVSGLPVVECRWGWRFLLLLEGSMSLEFFLEERVTLPSNLP